MPIRMGSNVDKRASTRARCCCLRWVVMARAGAHEVLTLRACTAPQVEGPIQYDAAIDPAVAAVKIKKASEVAGKATVFIFPDLNTGACISACGLQLPWPGLAGPLWVHAFSA